MASAKSSRGKKNWKGEYSGVSNFVCVKCGDKAKLDNALVAIKKAKGRDVECFKCHCPMRKLPS